MFILKEDQTTSIDAVTARMKKGVKSILLQGATGSGKSVIAGEFLHRAQKKNSTFWFLVPRKDLISQMAGTFAEFGILHSYIASTMPYNPHASGYIVSTETVKNRLDRLAAPRVAFIDETHFGAAGLDKIIAWLKQPHTDAAGNIYWTYIIGLSATPWKMSGQGLGCWYDEMVCGPSVAWLIANWRLSEYRPFAPSSIDLSQISMVGGDYNKGQLSDKMEHDRVLIGNSVNHYKSHALGRLGVTFGVSIKHSQILAEAYRSAGIPAAHVDGETPPDERKRIFKAYARRELLQLCNAELLTFGFDISSASGIKDVCVEVLTDCQPTKSLAKQMQKWGRALRFQGKDAAPHLIFDHANNFKEHGYPCDEREWTLSDRMTGKGDGGERALPVKLCPKCFFSHRPAPRCPNCGHEYPIESREIKEVDGELKEIELSKREKLQVEVQRKEKVKMQLRDAKTLADLRQIRAENKYHVDWIERMANAKGIKA